MNEESYKSLPLIWFALVVGGHVIAPLALLASAPGQEADPVVAGALTLAGLGEAGVALIGAPLLFRKVPARSAFIIRWGLCTSVSLMGAIAGFLGALPVTFGLWALGFAGMVAFRPTPDAFTAWELRRLEDE